MLQRFSIVALTLKPLGECLETLRLGIFPSGFTRQIEGSAQQRHGAIHLSQLQISIAQASERAGDLLLCAALLLDLEAFLQVRDGHFVVALQTINVGNIVKVERHAEPLICGLGQLETAPEVIQRAPIIPGSRI